MAQRTQGAEAPAPDAYEGRCWVCGTRATFTRERPSISGTYRCPSCNGPLRYQAQAQAILRAFGRRGARSIAELVGEPEFRRLTIFEPGRLGPFRRYFGRLRNYMRSEFDPSAAPGAMQNGVRNEDLMNLSFASTSIDLLITSDVFEHVREPRRAFAEVFRVLRPGGMHIFTIPGQWPLRASTRARVDVAGAHDVLLAPPVYHNDRHLVYNDFGRDLMDELDEVGFVTYVSLFASASALASRQPAFVSVRPSEGRA